MASKISDAERNDFIMKSLDEGLSLSEVQDQLAERFEIQMTYMELRLLTSELAVNWEKQDQKVEAARPKTAPAPAPADNRGAAGAEDDADRTAAEGSSENAPAEDDTAATSEEEDEYAAAQRKAAEAAAKLAAKTSVEVSKVVRPGAQLSGSVTFASGANGEWYIDQMGRFGLELADGSSKPTRSDMEAFQIVLSKKLGY